MRLIDADALFPCGAVPFVENEGFATADKLYGIIKNSPTVNAVVLPCKIGQTVWAIRRFHDKKRPTSGIVSEMFFTQQMKLEIVVKFVARGEWMKDVFPTREEAEVALAKIG